MSKPKKDNKDNTDKIDKKLALVASMRVSGCFKPMPLNGGRAWAVPTSQPGKYHIVQQLESAAWDCTCLDFHFRGGTCKHILLIDDIDDIDDGMMGA